MRILLLLMHGIITAESGSGGRKLNTGTLIIGTICYYRWSKNQYMNAWKCVLMRTVLVICSARKMWEGENWCNSNSCCIPETCPYRNCKSSATGEVIRSGCKWWHFIGANTEEALRDKYKILREYRGPARTNHREAQRERGVDDVNARDANLAFL